jgi:tetratricopeptide (TPR) repeat protein
MTETAILVRGARLIDALPQAEKVYADCQRLVADDVKAYGPFILVGLLAENLKRTTEAIALYDKALQRDPKAAIAYSRKADLYLSTEKYEDALKVYQAAVAAGVDVPAFHKQIGLILDRLNRLPEAVEEYRKAAAGARDDKIARFLLADALARQGKFQDAEEELKSYLAQSPNDAQGFCELAGIYMLENNLEAADRAVSQARSIDSQAFQPRAVQADVFYRQKKYPQCEALARDLLVEKPGEAGLRVLLALALSGQKKLKEAAAELKAMLAAEPERIEWRYLLSNFLTEMGDAAAAEKELLGILQKRPDHAGSNNDLGYLWADRGVNLAKAERMVREALKAEPKSAAYLDSLGWVLYKRGRMAEALKTLEAAAHDAPDLDAVIWDHLGDTYWRMSRRDDAAQAWAKAVDIAKARGRESTDAKLEHIEKKVEDLRAGHDPDVAPLAPKDQQGSDAPEGKPVTQK